VPERLYHYSTPLGALGIIKSGEVWASMIHYMNDSNEFKLALDLVRDIVAEHKDVPEHSRRIVGEEFIDVVKSIAVFVFSLTPKGDVLSQWRAYSSAAGGYSIGFNKDVLEAIAEDEGATLAACIYDRDTQVGLLRPVVAEMLEAATSLPLDGRGIDLYYDFAAAFTQAASLIKDESFTEEEEWRVIFGPGIDATRTDARVSGSVIVPYFKCPIKRKTLYPIAEVIVGPAGNSELSRRSLHYVTSTVLDWPAKVELSRSSFRVLV
jgi:hypothetical protein